jgi:glycogen(starch) synthase
MRIALITPEFVSDQKFDGGLANYTYRLAISLRDLGHEPVVIVKANKDKKFELHGLDVRYVNTGHGLPVSLMGRVKRKLIGNKASENELEAAFQRNSYWINKKLEQWNEETPFDLIHYSHLGGLGFHCPKDIPSIIRLSSSTRLCHERGGYGQSDEEMEQQERVENEAMQRVNAVFGPSRMIGKYVGNQIDRDIQIIETPFTLQQDELDDSILSDHIGDKKYLLFYGTLAKLKGVETIARVLKPVLEANPQLHFVFVGKDQTASDGSKMTEFLIKMAEDTASRLIFIQPQRHTQLYPIVKNASAVILPSLVDNFPNTCIESMAMGKIVVGTEKNGFEQLIDNQDSGFLIGIDDSDALLETLSKILTLPNEEVDRISLNAQKRIVDLHPDKVVRQLVEYYKEIIKKAGQ